MIRKIYLNEGSRIFFGDSPKTREARLSCKDGVFLGKTGDQIQIDSSGKITHLSLSEFGFDEDEEGIYFEV